MKAPSNSSIALSARETKGLPEGNGIWAEDTRKDNCVAGFSCLMRHAPRMDSKIQSVLLLTYRRAVKMLRARPHADKTGGNLSQNWKPFQQTKHERE